MTWSAMVRGPHQCILFNDIHAINTMERTRTIADQNKHNAYQGQLCQDKRGRARPRHGVLE